MDLFNATNQPVEIKVGDTSILIGPTTVNALGTMTAWVRRQVINEAMEDLDTFSIAAQRARHKLAWETASTVDMGSPIYVNMFATIEGLAKWLQVHATLATPATPMDYDTAYKCISKMNAEEVHRFFEARTQVNTPAHPTEPETTAPTTD